MPRYEYMVKDLGGEESSGLETAVSVEAAVDELHRRGFIVLNIEERDDRPAPGSAVVERLRHMHVPGTSPVSVRDLALFTRQLSVMLHAGLPLVRGLNALAGDVGNPVLRETVAEVAEDIQNGSSFSEALAEHPAVFSGLYTSMTRAGERSGRLDQVLEQLGDYLEKADALRTKVKSAMAYPCFVLGFAILSTMFLLLKVVPTFAGIYASFHAQLPAPTLFVLNLSAWMRGHVFVLLASRPRG